MLVGFPVKEFYVCKTYEDYHEDDQCLWIPAESIDEFIKNGWTLTDQVRMGYAVPAWIKNIDMEKPTILFLDDYSRK